MDVVAGSLERKIQRRFAPYAAVALLALLTTGLPPRPSNWTLVWIAAALTVAIAATAVVVPWSRMPRWTYVVPPLAYFGVVSLLGAATGGSVSGYAPLALLPVVWVALNLGRKEVALAGAAGCSLFLVPLVAGGAHYGAGEVRRVLLWAAVASIVGFSLESLMRDKRRQAREAREQTVALLAAEAASAIERADLLMHAQTLAETDELTGLPNRRSWDARIRTAVADATLGGSNLCVGLVDIDRFKGFNDRQGHQAGDRLLKTAASAWRGALRQGDVLARYGGDEFAVALPHCTLDEAEAVLERLRKLTPGGVTCSIGVARWSPGESEFDLVGRADEALYGAKAAGRDAVVTAA